MEETKPYDIGTVIFSKVAPKVYYMIETVTPSGYVANTDDKREGVNNYYGAQQKKS